MFFEMGQRLARPALQLRIIATFGVGVEERDRIPVRLELDLIVAAVELLAALAFQLIHTPIVRNLVERFFSKLRQSGEG